MSALTKESNSLQDAAALLLEASLKSGADSAEVCAAYGTKTRISLEKQDFHLTSSDEGVRLGLRVLRQGRQGFSSCNITDPKELRDVAAKAVQIAKFSPENPHDTIQGAPNIPKEAPSSPFDEALHQLSLHTQKDWTKLLRDEALKDPRFRINEGSVEIGSTVAMVLNSHGVRKVEKDTVCSWGLMGMGVEGDNITSFDYFHGISRNSKLVAEKLIRSTRQFTKSVLENLKVGSPSSYRGAVLFSPRAVIDILLDGLSYHLNGRTLTEGTGRFKFQDLGKEVFHKSITLSDMPWLPDRTAFSLFDREGTPTSNRALIEGGTISGFLLDHYSAHALKSQSTGNAAGGPASIPTVSSHCLALAAGDTPLKQLHQIASDKNSDYLLVNRFSGRVDPITGDFSGVAKGSDWYRKGERVYSVKETLISGNVFEAFTTTLLGISKEVEVIQDGEESPHLLIDNVSVTSHAS